MYVGDTVHSEFTDLVVLSYTSSRKYTSQCHSLWLKVAMLRRGKRSPNIWAANPATRIEGRIGAELKYFHDVPIMGMAGIIVLAGCAFEVRRDRECR